MNKTIQIKTKKVMLLAFLSLLINPLSATNVQTMNPAEIPIVFADDNVKSICVSNWDTNSDGELSYAEAAAVTELGEAFSWNWDIVSFNEFQYFDGLSSIEAYAFGGCSNLVSITLPNSVTTIGDAAFDYCRSLASITIPTSVTSIGGSAFSGCTSFISITIPKTVTSIAGDAFSSCNNLEEIIVELGNAVYDSRNSCNAIIETATNTLVAGCKSTVIPNSVVSIGDWSFYACNMLNTIVIPESVTSIGIGAFFGCNALVSIGFPESLTSIENRAFRNCVGLTNIELPRNVNFIGQQGFKDCYNLNQIISLAETPPTMGVNVFDGVNPNLTVFVPCGSESYYLAENWGGYSDFRGLCPGEVIVSSYPIEGGIVTGAGSYEAGQTFTITATANDGYSFLNWTENGSVVSTEPTYTSFVAGDRAFVAKFMSTESIEFADENVKNICVSNWDTNGDGELSYAEAAVVTNLNYAFSWNENIFSFDELQYFISLTSINEDAFSYCSNLISITLPPYITTIESHAFSNCSRLLSITLPNSLNSMGFLAFGHCSNLISIIVLPETPPTVDWGVFYGVSPYCTVFVPCGYGNAYSQVNWGDFSDFSELCAGDVTVSANPVEGGTVAGAGHHESGETFTVTATPNQGYTFVQWVENNHVVSFTPTYTSYIAGNRNLTANFVSSANIEFADDNVKDICVNNWDTNGDGELSYVEAAGVTNLNYAFSWNESIVSFDELQYFTGLSSFHESAFAYCTNLSSVILPPYITTINANAFSGCTNIFSITLPSSLQQLRTWAFGECNNLSSISSLSEMPPIIDNDVFYSISPRAIAFVPCSCDSAYLSTNWNSIPVIKGMCPGEVTVTPNPNNGGIVTGNGFYEAGQTFTVTATPAQGYAFANWTEDGRVVSTEPTYISYIAGSRNLVANFANESNIVFADENVKSICVSHWDTNGDGELSYAEAAVVTNLADAFSWNEDLVSFDELQYFISLSSINGSGFSWCTNLSSITLPPYINAIGSYTFEGCSNISSIILPSSINSIGDGAFGFCSHLFSVASLSETPPTLGWELFVGTDHDIFVLVPCGSESAYNSTNWNEISVIKGMCQGEVTVTPNPIDGGILTGNAFYEAGQMFTITATPAEGYVFFNWIEDERVVSNEPTYTSFITGDRSFVANFISMENIEFVDEEVKSICVSNWDTNGDGELSYDEASWVLDLGQAFNGNRNIVSFDELQYFVRLSSISESAFYGCTNLSSITLPPYITTIGSYAFAHCSILSITLPSSLNWIGAWGFGDCTYLHSIFCLSKTPPELGWDVFSGTCHHNVFVPCGCENAYMSTNWNDVHSIKGMCQGEVTVTPNPTDGGIVTGNGFYEAGQTFTVTATPAEGYAFANWTEDGRMVSTDSTYISYIAGSRNLVANFANESNIVFADENVKSICVSHWDTNGDGELSYAEAAVVTNLGDAFAENQNIVSFDELQYFISLSYIGYETFYFCGNLNSITIPNSVYAFSGDSFYGCNNLEYITVVSDNPIFDSRENCNALIETSTNKLVKGCKNTTIPNSVTTIASGAFYNCSSLTSIIIPSSVTYMCVYAFERCSGLSSVVSLSETPPTLEWGVFYDANPYFVVFVPCGYENAYISTNWNDVHSIKGLCPGEVTVTSNPTDGGIVTGNGFYEAGQTFTVTASPSGGYVFANWTDDGRVVSTNSIYTSYSGGSRNLVANFITEGNIEFVDENVKNICIAHWDTNGDGELSYAEAALVTDLDYAFGWNESISSFDELQYFIGLNSLHESAFSCCSNLTSITIPPYLVTIDVEAFAYCYALNNLTVLATTPPFIQNNSFLSVNNNIPVHVPCGTADLYSNTSYWSEFTNYQEIMVYEFNVVSANPRAGSATVLQEPDCVTNAIIQAVANPPYSFENWTKNGEVVSTEATYSFTLTGNTTYVANFVFSPSPDDTIVFADTLVKSICVAHWDTNGDGELSYAEAAAVSDMGDVFYSTAITSFNELEFFTGLTQLSWNTFSECYSLQSVIIPENVLYIRGFAFFNNFSLNITLPDQIQQIDQGAFACCRFTSFTIPSNVTAIGSQAFAFCSYLNNLTVSAILPPSIVDNTFQSVNKNIPVYVPCGSIDLYRNADYWNEFTNYQEIMPCVSFTIDVAQNPIEGGSVNGAGIYQSGETCTLIATPNTGYAFCSWTEDGVVVSESEIYSFIVTCDKTLEANFAPISDDVCNIIITMNDSFGDGWNGNYLVINYSEGCVDSEQITLAYGSSGTDTITVVHGSHIVLGWILGRWTDECSFTMSYENGVMICQADNLNENFFYEFDVDCDAPVLYYDITATANPTTGGTVTGTGSYEYGSICTLTAISNEGYNFVNWTENNEVVSTGTSYSFTITGNRSLVANFAITGGDSPGALHGVFSVSENTQVHFSQGNLQFQASTNTWRFAEHQWDYIGEGNNNISEYYDGWIDLFCWGTSGYNHGANCYQPWSTSQNNSDYLAYGSSSYNLYDQTGQADWGYNAISNGGNTEGQWHTLNTDEWDYVFNTRNTTSGIRWVQGKVNGKNGTILLPDDWDTTLYPLNDPNGGNYSSNTITADDWNNIFEVYGAVFLAPSGRRLGNSGSYGWDGDYWSSSKYNYNDVYYLYVGGGYVSAQEHNRDRKYGLAVRLVHTIQDVATSYTIEATSNPAEGGAVNGAGTYSEGAICTLMATANQGYSFVNWTRDDEVVSTEPSISFTVTEARTYIANFELRSYEITATVNPTAGGTITGAGTYYDQSTCTLMATPNTGYHFVNWSVNGTVVSTEETYSFEVTESACYVANFELNNYDITVTAHPTEGGTVTGAGAYDHGTTVTVTATANEDYYFRNWTENGVVVSTDMSYSFTVTDNRDLVANFFSAYHWNVDVYCCPFTMTFVGVVQINGEEQATEDIEIGAFVEGECRGRERLTNLYYSSFGHYYVFLNVHGDDGEETSFRLYDHSIGEEIDLTCSTMTFSSNITYGNLVDPYLFDFGSGDITQTTAFANGWNWWSTYIDQNSIDGLTLLEEGLGDNGVTVKSQGDGFVQYMEYGGYNFWYGTLDHLANTQTYLVQTTAPVEVELTGTAVSPSNCPITISQGWNWIGFPSAEPMDFETAFSGITPSNNDIVKSQNSFAQYMVYGDYGFWYGGLNSSTITPGMGLMYSSQNTESFTFTYPVAGRSIAVTESTGNRHWTNNVHAYPTNMTMLAVVELDDEELTSEDFELAAFANGECRGSAKLMYVEPLNRYMAFLTISGDEATSLRFGLYDTETGMESYESSDMLVYSTDATLGSFEEPKVIRFRGMTGLDVMERNLQMYPNPVERGGNVSILTEGAAEQHVLVEIINALGSIVDRQTAAKTPTSVAAPTKPGIYMIRITVESKGVILRKLVVE